MADQRFLESLAERLRSTATVESVYGQPIHAEGRTIVPVARVAYGFGGGAADKNGKPEDGRPATGNGGGGGVRAVPAGVVELTRGGTRFVPIGIGRRLLAAGLLGLSIGVALGRRMPSGRIGRMASFFR
jgi:uncharacterized spore protein YtfJ